MKIGIAGPVTLNLLNFDFKGKKAPSTYSFPMVSHLVNGLLKRGHQVVVFTLSDSIEEPTVIEGDNLTICIAKHEPHPGRDMFKSEREGLIQLMKQYPCDIINALWSYEFAWAALDTGVPTVVTLQDHATTILKYQFHHYRMMRWLMNYIVLRNAKHLVANSQYLFDLLTPKEKRKAVIINNFYASELEINIEDADPKKNMIVSVSHGFGKRKNIDTALFAFAIIRKQFPDTEYHIIGCDMEENGLAYQFAKENNLLDGVVFHGHKSLNEVLHYLTISKVILHPSREESFGMSVLESMVRGTPVVGGKSSGNVPKLLNNGQAGVLCDINSPEEIADSVMKILKNEDYATELRLMAFKYAKENYHEDVIINKYINYYKQVLKSKQSSKVINK